MSAIQPTTKEQMKIFKHRLAIWREDIFEFLFDVFGFLPAEPQPDLIDIEVPFYTPRGERKRAKLFSKDKRLIYPDLRVYTRDMFMFQTPDEFRNSRRNYLTWQQTIFLEAYNRGILTFNSDRYEDWWRQITARSGHGTGKTTSEVFMALHFLLVYRGAQIGVTANTESQLKDIFMKEFAKWHARLPTFIRENVEVLDDRVRIKGTRDWFLRARVAGKDNPEALAGLHGDYVLLIADEASGIWDGVFETMYGALTGKNWLIVLASNPTRTSGFFYNTHKKEQRLSWTQLHFNSLESPIVDPIFVKKISDNYGKDSDEWRVRVLGEFPDEGEMDERGWMPLFANIRVLFEKPDKQIIQHPIIGVDPAGSGTNNAVIVVRDDV